MKIVAAIPAFNEAERVARVISESLPHVSEVWVVDDGSADTTADVARKAGAMVFVHEQNKGKGAAIQTLIEKVLENPEIELVVFLDADCQHDPAELPKFIQRQKQTKAHIVLGNRMNETQDMPKIRLWTNEFTSWVLSRLCGQRVPDSQCGYRLLHRSVLPHMKFTTHNYETESEMLIVASRHGARIESVPIKTIYGTEKSRIRPIRDTIRFFKLVAKYRS